MGGGGGGWWGWVWGSCLGGGGDNTFLGPRLGHSGLALPVGKKISPQKKRTKNREPEKKGGGENETMRLKSEHAISVVTPTREGTNGGAVGNPDVL